MSWWWFMWSKNGHTGRFAKYSDSASACSIGLRLRRMRFDVKVSRGHAPRWFIRQQLEKYGTRG